MNRRIMRILSAKILFVGLLFAFLCNNCAKKGRFAVENDSYGLLYVNELIGNDIVYAGMTYEDLDVKIPVYCITQDGQGVMEYDVIIEKENEDYPDPDVEEIRIKDNKSGQFNVTVKEPGNYSYKIYQKDGNKEEITYDDKIYVATLFVTDNDGKLYCAISIKEEDGKSKPDEVEFVNVHASERETETEETTKEKRTKENNDETETDSKTESESRKDRIISTGDYFKLGALIVIMGGSLLGIVALVVIKNKSSDEDDNETGEN